MRAAKPKARIAILSRDVSRALSRIRSGSSYDPRYGSSQDYADPQARGADGRRHDAYQDSHSYQADRPYQEDGPAYQDPYRDNRSYDDVRVGDRQGQQYAADGVRHDGRVDDDYYQDDVPLEPDEDEMYDDAPRARRRGLATAVALISCAMLGTAGAYAYRSYSGNSGSMQPPPVITADSSTPTKIVPASAGECAIEQVDPGSARHRRQRTDRFEAGGAGRAQGVWNPGSPACGASGAGRAGQGGSSTAVRRRIERAQEGQDRGHSSRWQRPEQRQTRRRPGGCSGPDALGRAAARAAAAPAPKAAAAPPARSGGGPISLDRPASEPDPVPADAPPVRRQCRRRPGLRLSRRAPRVALSCNSHRRRVRAMLKPPSAPCRRNSPMSSVAGSRSFAVPISAAKGSSTGPW